MRLGDKTPPLALPRTWKGLRVGGRIEPFVCLVGGKQGKFLTPGWGIFVAVPAPPSSKKEKRESI